MIEEAQERGLLLVRMFDSYGQVPSPSRIDSYLEVIGDFPLPVFRQGIVDAMAEAGDFPPGPGTVKRAVIAASRVARESAPASDIAPALKLVPWKLPNGDAA